jgi:hypothetical protein
MEELDHTKDLSMILVREFHTDMDEFVRDMCKDVLNRLHEINDKHTKMALLSTTFINILFQQICRFTCIVDTEESDLLWIELLEKKKIIEQMYIQQIEGIE